PLRIHSTKLAIEKTDPDADCKAFLGLSKEYLKINREHKMAEDVTLISEMFLKAETAPTLFDRAAEDLWFVNIRTYLRDEMGIETTHADHTVSVLSKAEAGLVGRSDLSEENWYCIDARARSGDETPIYFLRIFAPVSLCRLTFSKTSNVKPGQNTDPKSG
ncbi:MAG: UTRA domain-containing protein, partial [Salaquimonas sp.]